VLLVRAAGSTVTAVPVKSLIGAAHPRELPDRTGATRRPSRPTAAVSSEDCCKKTRSPIDSEESRTAGGRGATVEGYTEWMKGLFTPVPDGSYELRAFAVDDDRNTVLAYAVFRGTHTGQGGPVPPTGKRVEADYVYAMAFDGDRIRHMTKIWNDGVSLQQLGWM
jgi:predicted ester cyclase